MQFSCQGVSKAADYSPFARLGEPMRERFGNNLRNQPENRLFCRFRDTSTGHLAVDGGLKLGNLRQSGMLAALNRESAACGS
tara:strand:- start:223 stop:468 length:246 start_codon:yes stop_codon:yes gene_type:complete